MTAPIVRAGGAPQAPVVAPRDGRRRDEASQAEGSFAALLAALAPDPAQPGTPAAGAAAPSEGQATLPGAGIADPLQVLLGQPREGGAQVTPLTPLPGEAAQAAIGQAAAAAGQAALQGELIAAEQTAAQQTGHDPVGNLLRLQGPESPGGQAETLRPGGLVHADPTAPVQAGEIRPAAAADGAEPAAQPGVPAGQASGEPVSDQLAALTRHGIPGGEAAPAGAGAPADEGSGAGDGAVAGEGRLLEVAQQQAPDAAPVPDPAGGAAPAAGPAAARGPERLTAGRLQVEQLVTELTRTLPELQDGQYRLTLRLHPEHLGEVRLELHLSGREVHAAMEVSSADARQALESRGEQLRQSLSDAGYQLTGFEVATGEGGQARRGSEDEPAGWPRADGRSLGRSEAPASPAAGLRRSPGPRNGRLDTLA